MASFNAIACKKADKALLETQPLRRLQYLVLGFVMGRFLLILYVGIAPFVAVGMPLAIGPIRKKSRAWYALITATGIFIVGFPLVIIPLLLFEEHP